MRDWRIEHGDCLDVMAGMDANSVDAVVTDPPYGLGFMGKHWDHGVPGVAYWAEALRMLKPGGHLLAVGGSRTYHRLACAVEDAPLRVMRLPRTLPRLRRGTGGYWMTQAKDIKGGPFGVIIADPPWRYGNKGVQGAAEKKYETMSISELRDMPVNNMAKTDAVLIMWATWPLLADAITLFDSWGFAYKTGLPWIKITSDPTPDLFGEVTLRPQYGTGFWVRGCSEPVLLGARGKAKTPSTDPVGLLSRNFGHSRKPDNIHELGESMDGPYLELFARRTRQGWTSWGNEL